MGAETSGLNTAVCREGIPKHCRVLKKVGLVEISLTPGNTNSLLVQALRKTC